MVGRQQVHLVPHSVKNISLQITADGPGRQPGSRNNTQESKHPESNRTWPAPRKAGCPNVNRGPAVKCATLMAADRPFQPAFRNLEQELARMKIVGIVLIVIGVISLAVGGISYTKREKVIDLGPIQATADRQKTIPLPPLLGGLALAGGVVLLIAGSKKR